LRAKCDDTSFAGEKRAGSGLSPRHDDVASGGLILHAKPATEDQELIKEDMRTAAYSVDAVEVFGRGVVKSEDVVVDKENNV